MTSIETVSERERQESTSYGTAMVEDVQSHNEDADEREFQNERRQTLSDTLANLTGGRFSPIRSTLNAAWDDISSTQQKYYTRKTQEAVTASLSVISPRQEKELWNSIRRESLINSKNDDSSKRKHFHTSTGLIDVLIKAHDQAESWQTKRQI